MNKGEKNERSGIVVGLAMNSVHYYEEEHGYPREAAISNEKMLAEGKKNGARNLESYASTRS